MIDDAAYEQTTGDPELDFINLEKQFREKLHSKLDQSENGNASSAYYIEYINHTLAAADGLGIQAFEGYTVPSHQEQALWGHYQDLATAVDNYSVQIRIAKARGRSPFIVMLSLPEKEKIRHYAEHIREIIEASNLEKEKREELLAALNDFLAKVDKEKTPLQSFTDLSLHLSALAGTVADNLEPSWKWIGLIAGVFGIHVQTRQGTIAAPKRRLQLEAPKKRLPPPQSLSSRLDDDIPF